jgi:argininosuccinate synthase
VFVTSTQRTVTGTARLKLYKGHCRLAGVKSPYSLYAANLASFKMGAEYDSTDATGFIRLFGLPMKVAALKRKGS